MKFYAVIGRWGDSSDEILGIWTTRKEADTWVHDYFNEYQAADQKLPWKSLIVYVIVYEVENNQFTELREFDRYMKQV